MLQLKTLGFDWQSDPLAAFEVDASDVITDLDPAVDVDDEDWGGIFPWWFEASSRPRTRSRV